MGSGEVAIVALSTMISLKVTFSDGLGGRLLLLRKGGDSGTVANMRPNFFSHTSIEMRKVL